MRQVGYAFVNFLSVKALYHCIEAKVGKKWNLFSSEKVLQVSSPPSLSWHKLNIRSLTPISSELAWTLWVIADQAGVNRTSSTSSGVFLLSHSNNADLQELCRHGGFEGVATFDLLVSQLAFSLCA
jgi:hypothetical protein